MKNTPATSTFPHTPTSPIILPADAVTAPITPIETRIPAAKTSESRYGRFLPLPCSLLMYPITSGMLDR